MTEKQKKARTPRELTPRAEVALIRQKLGHMLRERPPKAWLDTRSPRMNRVFGSEEFGIPYGKVIEVQGWEGSCKTRMALEIVALGQQEEAETGWLDLEGAWDDDWAIRCGVDPERVALIDQAVVEGEEEETEEDEPKKKKKVKEPRLLTAEELCTEAERWMVRRYQARPEGKRILVVDSVAAVNPEEDSMAALVDKNMRTKISTASFMSELLKRWVAWAYAYNTMIIFINQLRVSPNVRFGNPEYGTGGNALKFYSSVRVLMRRTKGGRIKQGTKVVGVQGTITNIKNRAGRGSREGEKVGFRTLFTSPRTKFLKVKDIKRDEG